MLRRVKDKIALHQITNGSWGSALDDAAVTVSDDTAYVVRVFRKQRNVQARVVGQSAAAIEYDSSADLGTGQSGFYSDKTDVKFDDFLALDGSARNPMVPRIGGTAKTWISSGWLYVDTSTSGGEALVENFSDGDYMVEASIGSVGTQYFWVRYQNSNNGYLLKIVSSAKGQVTSLYRVQNGYYTSLGGGWQENLSTPAALKVKLSGNSIKAWLDGSLEIDTTDSTFAAGAVAFGDAAVTALEIGYDTDADDDLDAGDDRIMNETFDSTSTTVTHDKAGNLVVDGKLTYTYDAWHRLVKATAAQDSDVVIGQYTYDGLGRRIKKVANYSGQLGGTELYYYDKQQVIEVRDGSENVMRQIYHGTQYIDEVVAERLEHGLAFVHQDANWNVIALTDFAGKVLEHNHYTPYGIATVDQATYFGDYDGTGFVDEGDWDTDSDGQLDSDDDCWGSGPSGVCRLVDFDFDGDVDSTDATTLDELDSSTTYRQPGQSFSGIGNTQAHQGLIHDAELGSYNSRHRQYAPRLKRFLQRDPLALVPWAGSGYQDGMNVYTYVDTNPIRKLDPTGLTGCSPAHQHNTGIGGGCAALASDDDFEAAKETAERACTDELMPCTPFDCSSCFMHSAVAVGIPHWIFDAPVCPPAKPHKVWFRSSCSQSCSCCPWPSDPADT